MHELIQDKTLREILSEYRMINKANFRNGNVLEVLNYAACVNFQKLKDVFSNLGISIDLSDLPQLAQVIEAGGDKEGLLMNSANQPVYFDAMQKIRDIRFTNEEINNTSCSIAWR